MALVFDLQQSLIFIYLTFFIRRTEIKNHENIEKYGYLHQLYLEKGFKGTVVNLEIHSINEGSLKDFSAVPSGHLKVEYHG